MTAASSNTRAVKARLYVICGAVIVVSAIALVLARRTNAPESVDAVPSSPAALTLPEGGEIYAIDTDIILQIEYEQKGSKFIAKREHGSGDPFTVEVARVGSATQRCAATRAVDALLRVLSSLRVTRELSPSETKRILAGAGTPGVLRVRDTIETEPTELRTFIAQSGNAVVLVTTEGQTFESTVPGDLLSHLPTVCSVH